MGCSNFNFALKIANSMSCHTFQFVTFLSILGSMQAIWCFAHCSILRRFVRNTSAQHDVFTMS